MKGQPCRYNDHLLCQEGDCSRCSIEELTWEVRKMELVSFAQLLGVQLCR
ncbi:MAG: hypothetical protein Q8O55_06625 [Dehalococcoidales bacterium]|nr:hypothetical protein [Dehalococcoidales bacterium]